jgi:hypothetical protein
MHDSNVFEELLDSNNSSKEIYTDSAYYPQPEDTRLSRNIFSAKVSETVKSVNGKNRRTG